MNGRGYAVISLDALGRYPAMGGAPVLMPLRRAATSADLAALHSDQRWQQLVAQG
jgi:hypothetical protein